MNPKPFPSLRIALSGIVLIAGLSTPSYANEQDRQYLRATNTQHAELPANGTIHVTNTLNELTIEGWIRPASTSRPQNRPSTK
jgi:hypothetical protein